MLSSRFARSGSSLVVLDTGLAVSRMTQVVNGMTFNGMAL